MRSVRRHRGRVMKRRYLLSLAGLLLASGCTSNSPKTQHACFQRDEAVETSIGYCQAIRDGDTLYVSGVAGQGDMPSAVRSVLERLKLTLETNGLSFSDVVKENVYATNPDAFIHVKGIRKEFYGASLPAATWVQVQRLYLPSFVVEIDLTAKYLTK